MNRFIFGDFNTRNLKVAATGTTPCAQPPLIRGNSGSRRLQPALNLVYKNLKVSLYACQGQATTENQFVPPGTPAGLIVARPWRAKFHFFSFIFFLFLLSCGTLDIIKDRLPEPQKVRGGYLFQLEAESAKIVYLAGDFNSWQKPPDVKGITLAKDPDSGIWKAVVDLKPGRYQYKFVVDNNTWIMDPNNPSSVDDGKGNVNSLVIAR